METKTKKIIAIVAAMLVVAAGAIGVGYKLWYGEDMPVVEVEAEVAEDSVLVAEDTVVFAEVADTVTADTVAEVAE